MPELTLRFDLSFGTRSLRCLMAAGMIFSVATEVASESVTLTTYYPAPSGIYSQMITTNNTYLARDGGKVGIGTTGPSAKLSVVGGGGATVDISVGGRMQTGDAGGSGGIWLSNANNMFVGQNGTSLGLYTAGAGWALNVSQNGFVGIGTASPGSLLDVSGESRHQKIQTTGNNVADSSDPHAADIVVGSDAGSRHDSSIMFWSNASASRILNKADVFYLSQWNETGAAGNSNVALNAAIGGASSFGGDLRVTGMLTATSASCFSINMPANGNQNASTPSACASGTHYITTVSGVYAAYMSLPFSDFTTNTDNGLITYDALCCTCPAATGCNL